MITGRAACGRSRPDPFQFQLERSVGTLMRHHNPVLYIESERAHDSKSKFGDDHSLDHSCQLADSFSSVPVCYSTRVHGTSIMLPVLDLDNTDCQVRHLPLKVVSFDFGHLVCGLVGTSEGRIGVVLLSVNKEILSSVCRQNPHHWMGQRASAVLEWTVTLS